MQRLILAAAAIAAFALGACAMPTDVNIEDVASTEQALVANYGVLAMHISRTPGMGFASDGHQQSEGAVARNFNVISYGLIVPGITYGPHLVATPAQIGCNGNQDHDIEAVYSYGLNEYLGFYDLNAFHAFWMVGQVGGAPHESDIWPECNLDLNGADGIGHSFSQSFLNAWSGFIPPDSHLVLSQGGGQRDCDTITNLACNGGIGLTHELLHGSPSVLANETPGDNYFAFHDGTIRCACPGGPGTCLLDTTSTACVTDYVGAPQVMLGYHWSADDMGTGHRGTVDETVEHKRLNGWFKHLSRPESTLVRDVGTINTNDLMLVPHDLLVGTPPSIPQAGFFEIRLLRPGGRRIYLEYRAHSWLGCTSSGVNCGTVDKPGVYVWLASPNITPFNYLPTQVQLSPVPSTSYRGLTPLPPFTQVQLEPHLAVKITLFNAAQARINVIIN